MFNMQYITVTNLNQYIKSNLESDEKLKNIQVVGEVSNLKIHHSGHWYFTLKDERSRINAVMFATYAKKMSVVINDGMKVVLSGDIGVYEQGGSYQLYVQRIEPIGLGNLYLQFEELKKELFKKGLFSDDHKISIPKFPAKIGVISAPQGAAIRDVITTLTRRWPLAQVELLPTLVQGKDAAKDIVNSLIIADSKGFDVIIVTRGGGSIEDLWPFNEEIVAYQIYKTNTPIISAIGHETDFTITDYVADLRAPTPTAAAELCTPNIATVKIDIRNLNNRLVNAINNRNRLYQQKFIHIRKANIFEKPEGIYAAKAMTIDNYRNKIVIAKEKYFSSYHRKFNEYSNNLSGLVAKNFESRKYRFIEMVAKINTLSPLRILDRGYSIVSNQYGVVKSIHALSRDDIIKIRLTDGHIQARIIEKENINGKEN